MSRAKKVSTALARRARARDPGQSHPLFLLAYSPELNAIERVWLHLRERFLSHRLWPTYDAILDACCAAGNALLAEAGRIRSLCFPRLGHTGHNVMRPVLQPGAAIRHFTAYCPHARWTIAHASTRATSSAPGDRARFRTDIPTQGRTRR